MQQTTSVIAREGLIIRPLEKRKEPERTIRKIGPKIQEYQITINNRPGMIHQNARSKSFPYNKWITKSNSEEEENVPVVRKKNW